MVSTMASCFDSGNILPCINHIYTPYLAGSAAYLAGLIALHFLILLLLALLSICTITV